MLLNGLFDIQQDLVPANFKFLAAHHLQHQYSRFAIVAEQTAARCGQ